MDEQQLAFIRAQQELIDLLPPEIKTIVWEHGFAAVPEIEMRRYRAMLRRKEKGRLKGRPSYVAPVIDMAALDGPEQFHGEDEE
jgi:hypothetical protein